MWSRKLANDSNFLKQKGIGWIFLHRNYFGGTGCQESEWLNRGEYYNLKWDSTAILASSCATVNPGVWSAAATMRKIMAEPLASSADNCYRKEQHMVIQWYIPVSWSTHINTTCSAHFNWLDVFSTAKNDGYMSYWNAGYFWPVVASQSKTPSSLQAMTKHVCETSCKMCKFTNLSWYFLNR